MSKPIDIRGNKKPLKNERKVSNRMSVTQKNGIGGKECSSCKIWKSLEEFPKDSSKGPLQGERHCVCKECKRGKNKKT
jgi:hypothetical protein